MGTFWETNPIKIENIETGEIYQSLQEAGRKLGYLSALKIPDHAKDGGDEFRRRGYRLRILL